jgi:hypothetical protein
MMAWGFSWKLRGAIWPSLGIGTRIQDHPLGGTVSDLFPKVRPHSPESSKNFTVVSALALLIGNQPSNNLM